MKKKAKQTAPKAGSDAVKLKSAANGAHDPTDDGAEGLRRLVDALAAKLTVSPASEGAAADEGVAAAAKAEAPDLVDVLRQLKQRLQSLRTAAGTALEKFVPSKAAGGQANGNANYMEMKVQLLTSYHIYLVYYLLLKTQGVPVDDHPVVPRLIWVRTLLEKLRPVDQRLQYQMTKLLQWATAQAATGDAVANDPRALRPGDLTLTVQDEGQEASDGEAAPAPEEWQDDGIYRPPKVAQMEYTGDHVTEKEKAERDLERKRGRLQRSEFVRSLREEFTDAPTEFHGTLKSSKAEKAARMFQEQRDYEEDHLIRLRMNKKEARSRQRDLRDGRNSAGGSMSTLDDITQDFKDVARGLQDGKGRGKGKGRRGGGGALREYQDAVSRVQSARKVVNSTIDGDAGASSKRGGTEGGPSGKKRRK